MESGYTFTLDGVEYVSMRGADAPFTLLDCWRIAYGCAGVSIFAPNGRLVLADAGSLSARAAHAAHGARVRRRAQARAYARRVAGAA
jgi:hypothetical protein